MKFIITLITCLLIFSLEAQIVTVTPSFPNKNTEITITYDATQGSGGLTDVDQVYMHAGLITVNSTGNSDWKYVIGDWGTDDDRVKLTNIGDNKHQKTYVIKDFHQIPDDEEVLMLAFVFRNVDGSKEGKTASFGDIFVPVSDGDGSFKITRNSPSETTFVVSQGATFNIAVQASATADYRLLDNSVEMLTGNGSELTTNYNVSQAGDHVIKYEFINGTDTIVETFSFTTPPVVNTAELENDDKPGITIINDTTVRFVLTAPQKTYVHLIGDFNDWSVSNKYAMNLTADGNYWWYDLVVDQQDFPFCMQYMVDGSLKIADPFSELVLDRNNDKYIPSENFPDLYEVSNNGPKTGYVSLVDPDRLQYEWTTTEYNKPKQERLVIYELLMRDFVETRSYQTLLDTLDYLENLGINAIEFMPINEFEGNQSWGYNPSFHMALDKAYGTPKMFKQFVDEAHNRGIAIILDVVYNHAFGQSPLVQLYWDSNSNKPSIDNPWINPDAKHPYNVGFDFNHESQFTKDFVDQVVDYWVEEYNIDGFRFDLSKGFTQTQTNSDGAFAQYDESRVAILKRIASTLWNKHPDTYVILEHFANNVEEKILTDFGMMVWGNFNHNYSEGALGYNDSNFSGIDHKRRDWTNNHLVSYMESHDEDRMMYRLANFGNSEGDYDTQDFETSIDRAILATHFFLTIPGPKLIWQFGELGFDYSINRCEDGSINNNCRLSLKPIEWDYALDPLRDKLHQSYSLLNELRNTHDLFHTEDYTLDVAGFVKQITLENADLNCVIIGNFDVTKTDAEVSFPHDGNWYNFYSDKYLSTSSSTKITLKPGEFRMYFDKDIDAENILLDAPELDLDKSDIRLYPNPVNTLIYFNGLSTNEVIEEVKVIDLSGRLVISNRGTQQHLDVGHLSPGVYTIRLKTSIGFTNLKFVKI